VRLFGTLFVLMLVGHLDRQVVVAMFPYLRDEWRLLDVELGSLASVVPFVVALLAVPVAMLADRIGYLRSIVAMALLWSLATIGCALATGYGSLLAIRALVGIGEAGFAATAAALLATRFPPRARGTLLGAFLVAAVLGNAAGLLLGAWASAAWGWRTAFVLAGLPGLVLAAILVTCERTEAPPPHARGELRARPQAHSAMEVLGNGTLMLACLGSALQVATVGAVMSWLPLYLQRYQGAAPEQAGRLTAALLMGSVVGAVLGGTLSDRAGALWPSGRAVVAATVAAATGASCLVAFGPAASPAGPLWAIVVVTFLMTGCIGPAAAIVVDLAHPSVRATATAFLAVTQNVLGLAAGPLVIGMAADALGLAGALSLLALASFASSIVFGIVATRYRRARARVQAEDAAVHAATSRSAARLIP
jgi:MFS family permease